MVRAYSLIFLTLRNILPFILSPRVTTLQVTPVSKLSSVDANDRLEKKMHVISSESAYSYIEKYTVCDLHIAQKVVSCACWCASFFVT